MKIIRSARWQMTRDGFELEHEDAYEYAGPVAKAGPAMVAVAEFFGGVFGSAAVANAVLLAEFAAAYAGTIYVLQQIEARR